MREMMLSIICSVLLCLFVETSHGLMVNSPTGTNLKTTDLKAVVVVPGFLTGAEEFQPLVETLKERGIPAMAVPMPNWQWLPCLGGRSFRPVMDRIDMTVRQLCAANGDVSKVPQSFESNPFGAWRHQEEDPKKHSRPLPQEEELGNKKIAIVAHSAGGWISRAYLSDRIFDGHAYHGHKFVHSLVTLGTPHVSANGPVFEGVAWCNQEPNEPMEKGVRVLTVGSKGFQDDKWGILTRGSYALCSPGGPGSYHDGDGVTPIQSALGLDCAEKLELSDVTHFAWSDVAGGELVSPELTKDHREGRPWYGSKSIVDKWAPWLEQTWKSDSPTINRPRGFLSRML